MRSYMEKSAEVKREWHLIDLENQVLGRVAVKIAKLLAGKHKPTYTPHIDAGDYVVVINASKLIMTGNKLVDKKYYSHSGQPGGFKEKSITTLLTKYPERVVAQAVKGMLAKNKLSLPRLKRLKVYPGAEHPYSNHLNNKES